MIKSAQNALKSEIFISFAGACVLILDLGFNIYG